MKKAFTIAEVLITLAIIGVISAIIIPSVITTVGQQEYKSGIKKAVSDLNSAITAGTTFSGDTPYTNTNLYEYLKKYMSVMKFTDKLSWDASFLSSDGTTYKGDGNAAFYTVDGMRYEFLNTKTKGSGSGRLKLHESNTNACMASAFELSDFTDEEIKEKNLSECGGCGSLGLKDNPNLTDKVPCAILVDVNGDRRPTPKIDGKGNVEPYKPSDFKKNLLTDVFVILITENRAIPYGVATQRAMYWGKINTRR